MALRGPFSSWCKIGFMVENAGKWPIDGTTDIGKFRIFAGDSLPDSLPTDEEPCASYKYWSDSEVENYLSSSNTLTRAIANAYNAISLQYLSSAGVVKDFDMTNDNTKTASFFEVRARYWGQKADAEDLQSLDSFDFVVPNWQGEPSRPEGSPYRWA